MKKKMKGERKGKKTKKKCFSFPINKCKRHLVAILRYFSIAYGPVDTKANLPRKNQNQWRTILPQ